MINNTTDHDFTGLYFREAWQESLFRQAKADLAYINACPEELIRRKRIGTLLDVFANAVRRMDVAQKTAPWEEGWLDRATRSVYPDLVDLEAAGDVPSRGVILATIEPAVRDVVAKLDLFRILREEESTRLMREARERREAAMTRMAGPVALLGSRRSEWADPPPAFLASAGQSQP